MPTPSAWQAEISRAGFPVELDQDFDADAQTGFLPCQYNGSISGFEYYSRKLTEADAVRLDARGNDFSVTLVVHAGHNEMQTALAAAGALCVASEGILDDPQLSRTFGPGDVLDWARSAILECPEHDGDA
jgi:hypothetical protein